MKNGIAKVMKKLLGGGTAVVLSLAMALGVFTGMGIEAKAEENYMYVKVAAGATEAEVCQMALGDLDYNYYSSSDPVIIAIKKWAQEVEPNSILIIRYEIGSSPILYDYARSDSSCQYEGISFTREWSERGDADKLYVLTVPSSFQNASTSTSSQTASTAASQKSGSETPVYVHTHSYSWVTVQEANSEQDGIEEYRCSCGDVQEKNIIPASEVLVKGLFGEIKDAPLNGSTAFDTGRQYTLSDYIIRKLSERTDVTTVITFEYEGQPYRMTIPAGADYSQLLADEDYFYGYFYFANAVGAVIEAL